MLDGLGVGDPVLVVRGGGHVDGTFARLAASWVVRAQDGGAAAVLAEIDRTLAAEVEPQLRVRALYARAIALHMLGRTAQAVPVARELSALCRDLGLLATGLRARALLSELLRRDGQREEAVEQLAHAVAIEPALRDIHDPEVQIALGALAVALRQSGVAEETRRVEDRLAPVESELPRDQRVSRWSNLAFEHALAGMAAARRPSGEPDPALLRQAVEEIGRAEWLAAGGSYDIVVDEAAVLRALHEAAVGDPQAGLAGLERCAGVLDRGAEAAPAQLLWAVARLRALLRLRRCTEAVQEGRELLHRVEGGRHEGDRLALAYEVLRAEEAVGGSQSLGARAYVALAEERMGQDVALLAALFRARVDLLRGADERRLLARAASLDSLTGLVNRRGAAVAITSAARRPEDESVALLLVDLDGFKGINDSCGHLAGDVALQRVAEALRTAARVQDVVARWGGDEFVVIASLEADQARPFADRLRDAVRESCEPGAEDAVTASVGVAVRAGPVDEEAWLRRADEAMYAAKRSGGDATVVA